MRKIFQKRRAGYYSACRRKFYRILRSRQSRARKRGSKLCYSILRNRGGSVGFTRIKAPAVWSLYEVSARRELLRFLEQYRQIMLNGNGGAIVDFSLTKTIRPSGGLIVHAELDRVGRLVTDRRRLKCKPALANSVADQVLKQVGMYDKLDHVSAVSACDQSVVHWRHATGVKVEGEQAWSVVENFEGEMSDALKTSLFKGITEALTNAVQHAYIAKRRDGTYLAGEKRWWLFSQQRDGFLTVVFCDLGIGIPESLPIQHSGIGSILKKLSKSSSDVLAIKIATELGETSTDEPNRGKGLPEILDAARKSEQGSCVIYSNKGQFGYGAGGNLIENQFSNSIFGTLIEWRVPLSEQSCDDAQN